VKSLVKVSFCSINHLFIVLRYTFQLEAQVRELVLGLFVYYFLDSLLFDFGFGTSRCGWLAKLLDTKFFFCFEFGLRLLVLPSDFLVYFCAYLTLFGTVTNLDKVTDFILIRSIIAIVMHELDQSHMIVEPQLYLLEDFY